MTARDCQRAAPEHAVVHEQDIGSLLCRRLDCGKACIDCKGDLPDVGIKIADLDSVL